MKGKSFRWVMNMSLHKMSEVNLHIVLEVVVHLVIAQAALVVHLPHQALQMENKTINKRSKRKRILLRN